MSAPNLISPTTLSGGTPVGGTGATNTIPRWTGASTLGDSVITQSGTLLGVNKAVPTSTIDVDGLQTNSSGTSAVTPTGTLRLNFAGQPTPGYGASIVFSQQWFAGSPTNYVAVGQITGVKTVSAGFFGGGIALWYNNGGNGLVEGMRINDTGNVGIGTASPAGKLEVSGAGDQTVWITATSAGSTTLSLYPSGGGLAQINAVGASNLAFRTNNTERARIDSSGNFGLGVLLPANAATLNGFYLKNAANLSFLGPISYFDVNSYYGAAADRYAVNGFATRYSQFNGAHIWYTAASGTGGNAISFSEVARIDSSGNVGIGTASPASRLDVAGTITCDDAGTGLKLPATPGNTDPNTLDAYRDGGTAGSGGATFTATLKGGTTDPTTPVTKTGYYVLVGKMLTLTVYFDNVDTTGASGAVYVTTNLPAALYPAVRTPGSVGLYQFTTGTAEGTFVDARTSGELYIATNVNNGNWGAVTYLAGAGKYMMVSVTYIIP